MAATATATREVRQDVCAVLKIPRAQIFCQGFNRPNLMLVNIRCRNVYINPNRFFVMLFQLQFFCIREIFQRPLDSAQRLYYKISRQRRGGDCLLFEQRRKLNLWENPFKNGNLMFLGTANAGLRKGCCFPQQGGH